MYTQSLHWHIQMWWKPSAETDKVSVSSVCACACVCDNDGSALLTPLLCHVLACLCFYKCFQMQANDSSCSLCMFVCVCVCTVNSHIQGDWRVFMYHGFSVDTCKISQHYCNNYKKTKTNTQTITLICSCKQNAFVTKTITMLDFYNLWFWRF